MTVIRQRQGQPWAFAKGAPEVMLERCTHLRTTHRGRARCGQRPRPYAPGECADGQRCAARARPGRAATRALASADSMTVDADAIEQDLTFLGLIGLQDPPRAEALDAVKRCKRAGIRTVMITGDHPDTAGAIARELGILERGDTVVVGPELDRME